MDRRSLLGLILAAPAAIAAGASAVVGRSLGVGVLGQGFSGPINLSGMSHTVIDGGRITVGTIKASSIVVGRETLQLGGLARSAAAWAAPSVVETTDVGHTAYD